MTREQSVDIRLDHLQLNELELVLAGVYGECRYQVPGQDRVVPTLGVHLGSDVSSVALLDLENTPVARIHLDDTLEDGELIWLAGAVEQLAPMATRPYPAIRTLPTNSAHASATLILDEVPAQLPATDCVVVADFGRATPLAQAVEAALHASSHVYVLPVPRAQHLTEEQRDDLVIELARCLYAPDVEPVTYRHPRREGTVVLFTGLSGAGKSTIAHALAQRLRLDGRTVTLLDGDVVRGMLSSELGFSREDRELNVRRIGWVASTIAEHGGVAICAPIAPYASMRAEVRDQARAVARFVLVYLSAPLDVCEARDRKGLYAKARKGEIASFTGISDPYEVPTDADVVIDTSSGSVEAAVDAIVNVLEAHPVETPARP